MKSILKAILTRLSTKNVNEFARRTRRVFYTLLDLAGHVLLAPHRFLTGRWGKHALDDAGRILIVRIDRIGDVILSTPALRAVRESFPNSELDLLVAPYTRDLVAGNPHLDRVLVHGEDALTSDYDMAFVLHPGIRQNRLAYRSGAGFRAGYTSWGGGFYLTHRQKDDRAVRIRHEVESALEIVGMAGCRTGNRELEISTTEEGELAAGDFFRREGIEGTTVVIHPGARQEYIRWKKEGFAAVADALIRGDGVNVLLTGSQEERGLLEEIAGLMEEKPYTSIGPALTVLVSLISRCQVFLGNSTGPMHIAAALEVPVVATFGAVHPLDSHLVWGPWGEGHIVVRKDLDCGDCHPTDCTHYDCMNLMTVEMVLEAVRTHLRKASVT